MHANTLAPEFDDYAADYAAGMEDPFKRLAGGSFAAFIDLKAGWLLRDLARHPLRSGGARLLDFGCGTGEFLQSLRRHGFAGELCGCDVSGGMLAEAARRWPDDRPPALHQSENAWLPYPANGFDVVLACCVLHHVPPAQHPAVFLELARVLKPGGRLVVFEHNPLNPLTRWIVARAPIDRHAILFRAAALRRALAAEGLTASRTAYLLFFPPRFRRLRALEGGLGWLPLGGQYALAAEKPL